MDVPFDLSPLVHFHVSGNLILPFSKTSIKKTIIR